MSINKANRFYSENYAISLQTKDLESSPAFHTHTSIHAERLHRLSEVLLLPARLNLQILARIIEPLPGRDKNHSLKGIAIRVTAAALFILSIPFAALSIVIGLPLRYIDHAFRPAISYIDNSKNVPDRKDPQLTEDQPLHIRSHNLGFVTSSMSTLGDLRPPTERAHEVAKSINEDPIQPDVIFFQEAFHEDALKILCNGIKGSYPYILHSIAPSMTGFNSGSMVVSKYPIEKIDFHTLGHMMGPERASPRGITKVRITSTQGPVLLYGVHTQALVGEDRANARIKQVDDLARIVRNDHTENTKVHQVIVGDFNASRITAWGENNEDQAENDVMNKLNEHFVDLYLDDHNELTGKRKEGTKPRYLDIDNKRMEEILEEPSGSWYHGPFANPGVLLSHKMRKDRENHGRSEPKQAKGIQIQKVTWGTSEWHAQQTANTARFDYVLTPKFSFLKGDVEIRRTIVPKSSQSAPTDHLPVDGRIWINLKSNHTT